MQDFSLAGEDVAAIVDEVKRFSTTDINKLVEKPEFPISQDQLGSITSQACENGLLHFEADFGFGIWASPDHANSLALSLQIIEQVARANTGIAWHWHQLALGRWLLRRLGLGEETGQEVIVAAQGNYGLGRQPMARWLRSGTLSDEDREFLKEYFNPILGRLIHAGEGWQQLIIPAFDDRGFCFRVCPRDKLMVDEHEHSHGLDEMDTFEVYPDHPDFPGVTTVPDHQGAAFRELLILNSLAMIALAQGSVRRAYDKAREYTSIRQQGGKIIDQHAAVQLLLADIQNAIQSTEVELEALSRIPLSGQDPRRVLSARLSAHPRLCHAANQAMQAFGGIGYMQDTGIEKILRDNNHLRRVYGTPVDLQLFISEWERNDG